jgi:hypothetical protein
VWHAALGCTEAANESPPRDCRWKETTLTLRTSHRSYQKSQITDCRLSGRVAATRGTLIRRALEARKSGWPSAALR